MLPQGGFGKIEDERLLRGYIDGHAFVKQLKLIGAHVLENDRRPLGPGALRRVLRHFDAGIAVTYNIAYGLWRRA